MHPSQTYPSDLTDDQWHILQPLIPKPKLGGRPIIHSRRMILNAIYYVNRSGCQWSMLPKDFPPKSTVFDYFSAWRKSALWEKLNESLRVKVRVAEGRKPSPTAAILDSQSVKGAEQGGDTVGYDAGKKIGGRKRHLLVDTLGMILGVKVTPASVQDREGAVLLLASLYLLFGRLQVIWADGGYAGALVAWVKGLRPFGKLHLDIVRRSDDAKGFQLVKKRWIVERTFRWLYKSRRLSRDYEQRPDHSESHIYVCMSRLMLKRLAKQ
jgi:putative transposase